MNWRYLRAFPWMDTRARIVAAVPPGGSLLDLGSSDGQTLRHFAELRPDIKYFSADIAGNPERYPAGTVFARCDFNSDPLPWPDAMFDAVTCMHVIEHLAYPAVLLREAARVLRPGGSLYVETPHAKSLKAMPAHGNGTGSVTLNFFDDPTHVRIVPVPEIVEAVTANGLRVESLGASRNLLIAAAYPFFRLVGSTSRKRFVSEIHWTGWSAYVAAQR